MDSTRTEQLNPTTPLVRRVAILGAAPGLGMGPTLLASSPRFHAEPRRSPTEHLNAPSPSPAPAIVTTLTAPSRPTTLRPRFRRPLLARTVATPL